MALAVGLTLGAWVSPPLHGAKTTLAIPAELDLRGVLSSTSPPTTTEVERLVVHLGDRDPAIREAIVDRLAPFPHEAARRTLSVFRERRLASQLTALELLRVWRAPVGALDPWRPGTVTRSMPALESWAHSLPAPSAPGPEMGMRVDTERDLAELTADSPGRAAGAIERLVRAGPTLLPRIRALEGRATGSKLRQTLATLRYRLIIPPAFALREPGLARWLAMATAQDKVAIIDRLSAEPGEVAKPLLIELFLDPHPLVRETAMKALLGRADLEVADDLARLLLDSDANVRAAVLKQLTEKPLPELVPRLAEFIARERDEDLLVHATRALGNTTGSAAMRCLIRLLTDSKWRVRAEAVEAVGRKLSKGSWSPSESVAAELRAAVLGLLDDKDGYVVSRAISAAKELRIGESAPVLVKIAERDPGLAVSALDTLASLGLGTSVEKSLRSLVSSRTPAVRAAAIRALAGSTGASIGDEVQAALGDRDADVRYAALTGLLEILRKNVGSADRLSRRWPASLVEPLQRGVVPLLAAIEARERIAAASVLAVLGDRERAFPVLIASFSAKPDLVASAVEIFPDLDWARRRQLFEALMATHPGVTIEKDLIKALGTGAPEEGPAYFWGLLESRSASADLVGSIGDALFSSLGGKQLAYTRPGKASLEAMARQAREHLGLARTGVATVALRLLLYADPDAGAKVGREVFADARVERELRLNALRLMLSSDAVAQRGDLAVTVLKSQDTWALEPALAYLSLGGSSTAVRRITVGGLAIPLESLSYAWMVGGGQGPTREPNGLTPELLRPHLRSTEGLVACYAAHLLALLGDPGGLPVLVKRWRTDGARPEDQLRDLLTDAIAALDDDGSTPLLARIYRSMSENQRAIRDLYQKLRLMTGPGARGLRKQIRSDVGRENLQ
ncbi:MAG: HEAT repeat domain-containing protein [Candidatus Riflebacteria bacterium]|nr:HEAT repeat domain-containing protein [Candidatus Riflebacteria bacterium]